MNGGVELNVGLSVPGEETPGNAGQGEFMLVTYSGRATDVTGIPAAVAAKVEEQRNSTRPVPHEPASTRGQWHRSEELEMRNVIATMARIRRG